MPPERTAVALPRLRWVGHRQETGSRTVPEEAPVALIHDASTTAVMMATPADVADLALGFSLTEQIIANPADIRDLEIVETPLGIEARIWLKVDAGAALNARRRRIAGPTGCGLCGVESLEEAVKPPRRVGSAFRLSAKHIAEALATLETAQVLGRDTRAVHAAGWWGPAYGLAAVREDVGRHNALDKLVGALATAQVAPNEGALLLTSRVSVEMVQKAAAFGAQVLIAVSAPTALAVRTADAAGMTLIAIARQDGFEVFTHAERIVS